ncbi:MAG: amidohydrolase [Clostridia bacterium]|nr:amidohydrolase [Clostridia bacterium]
MKIQIKNAHLITMDDGKIIENGCLCIENEKISYVGDQALPDEDFDRTINARGAIVMPGLVNAHTHTPMTLFRGYADDMTLNDWLFNRIFPAEDKLDTEAVYWGSLLACAEMIKSGTTLFADMYFMSESTIRAVLESGINANIARCVTGTNNDYKDRLYEAEVLYSEYDGANAGAVKIDFSAHAVYTCSKEALKAVAESAAKHNAAIHIHLSETMKENRDCYSQYGKSPTEVFRDMGIFNCPTNAAHCVFLSENDMEILAENNVGVSHNPISNLKLASGVANVNEMLAKNILIGVGTDGTASNNSLDIFAEMKTSAILQKGIRLDPTLIPARKALEMATATGAEILGRGAERGQLKKGMRADVIILERNAPNLIPVHNPESTVVYSANGANVQTTIINGKIVMENRELLTIDMDRVASGVKDAVKRMGI